MSRYGRMRHENDKGEKIHCMFNRLIYLYTSSVMKTSSKKTTYMHDCRVDAPKRSQSFVFGAVVGKSWRLLDQNCIVSAEWDWRYVGLSALTMSPSSRSTLTSPTVGLNNSSCRVDRQSARAGGNSSKSRPTLRASLSHNTVTVCSCNAAIRPGSHNPRDSKRTTISSLICSSEFFVVLITKNFLNFYLQAFI